MTDLLAGLESAEEIFASLGVAPDPRVLSAARLHVLRAFGALVAQVDAVPRPEAERRALYADALRRAQSVYAHELAAGGRAFDGKGCAGCGPADARGCERGP